PCPPGRSSEGRRVLGDEVELGPLADREARERQEIHAGVSEHLKGPAPLARLVRRHDVEVLHPPDRLRHRPLPPPPRVRSHVEPAHPKTARVGRQGPRRACYAPPVRALLISNSGRPYLEHCEKAVVAFLGAARRIAFVTAAALTDEIGYYERARSALT